MIITQEITVDVARKNAFNAIVAKQLDLNSRFLKIKLTDMGNKLFVNSNATALIDAQRPDNNAKSFKCVVNDDGTITAPLKHWMLELEGYVKCDIAIVDADNSKLTSTTFSLLVEKRVCECDTVTDDDGNDLIVTLINDVSVLKEDIENIKSNINNINTDVSDIRTAADGTTYETAGEAVRAQVNEIKGDLVDITELFEPKLNLLNTVECKSNTWMNADGSIQYNDTYWITNFISVKSGQTVYFTNRTNQIKMRSIIVFDSDKKVVLNSITSGNELYAYTNNSDTKQYIVGNNNNNNNMHDVMAIGTYNYDSTYKYPVLAYEEYILVLKKDSNTAQEIAETAKANAETAKANAEIAKKELDGFVLNMRNVFDFNACLVNHWLYDRNDNPIVEYEGYTVTDYILVPPQKIIVFSEGAPYYRTALKLRKPAIIYDINKVKIGSYNDSDNFFYYYNNTDDYVYVRFNIQRTADNYYMAELIDYTEEPVFSQIYYEFGKTFIDKSCVIDLMEDAENVGVRDFFKSEIDDTVSKILSLTDKPSYCMTFVTDTHYAPDDLANKRRTFDTLHNLKAVNKKVYSIGLSSTGDFVRGNQDQYTQTDIDAICNTVRMGYLDANPKVYMVNGNHDGIGGGVPKTNNYNSVMSHNEDYVIRENDNPYFYADHKKVKIRGIYLSTNTQIGDSHIWGMGTDEIQWLKSVLDTTPKDYSVIFYSHIGIFSEQFINGRVEVQSLVNSFHNHTGDYANRTGKCIAWFCGHEHFDWICPTSQSGVDFPVIVTTASHLAGWNPPDGQYPGASAPTRNDGTVTQDAWDTIIYRPDEDKLYMVRFGAGEDREINLATWDKTQ